MTAAAADVRLIVYRLGRKREREREREAFGIVNLRMLINFK